MWTKATGHIGTVIRPWAASTPGEEWGHRRTMGGQRISFLTKRVPTSESELSSHLKHPPLFLQCILWSVSPLPLPWFPVQKRTPGQACVWIRTWPASPLEKAMTPKVNKLVDKQKNGKGQCAAIMATSAVHTQAKSNEHLSPCAAGARILV